jgi:hypothetical protein
MQTKGRPGGALRPLEGIQSTDASQKAASWHSSATCARIPIPHHAPSAVRLGMSIPHRHLSRFERARLRPRSHPSRQIRSFARASANAWLCMAAAAEGFSDEAGQLAPTLGATWTGHWSTRLERRRMGWFAEHHRLDPGGKALFVVRVKDHFDGSHRLCACRRAASVLRRRRREPTSLMWE